MSNNKYTMKNGKAVEVYKEIYKYLMKFDRRIRYVEEDLKRNTYIIDSVNEKVTVISKREQSLDRLTELGKDFSDSDSDFQDGMILKIMLDKALAKLSDEERHLITQLFYFMRSEKNIVAELNVTRRTISNRKRKILLKLCKLYRRIILFSPCRKAGGFFVSIVLRFCAKRLANLLRELCRFNKKAKFLNFFEKAFPKPLSQRQIL